MLHLKTVKQQTLLLALLLSAPLMSITSCTKGADNSTQVGIKIDETNFPDENFRSYLLAQDYGTDGVLTAGEIEGITKIDVWGKKISDLKGVELFTALTELMCANNQLTTLDVSKNTALTSLDCCANQLTTLDVSKCTALTAVYCSNNQIKGSSMDALIGSLPQTDSGRFAVYNHGYGYYKEEGNVCTTTQVAAAKAKGWTPCQAIGSCGTGIFVDDIEVFELIWSDYEGSDD